MYSLGQYVTRQSPVHQRDPRVKIIGVIAFSVIMLKIDLIGLLGAMGLIMGFSYLARIPLRLMLKSLRPVLPFFFFLFLIYIFLTPGRPLPILSGSPIQITYDGLYLGLQQVGRFLLLVLAASLLTMTTAPNEITAGLEYLLRPLKFTGISSHNTAMMVSLALRFIPTLIDEMNSISAAQLARGANFNPRRPGGKIRTVSYLALPLTINIFRRCDELVDAMEARGYQQGHRTYLRELELTRMDYGLLTVIIAATIVILLMY